MPRARRRAADRTTALVLVVATAAVLAGVLLVAPDPAEPRAAEEVAALAVLLHDVARAEAGSWRVEWAWSRTTAGGERREAIVEARLPGRRVLAGGGSVQVEVDGRRVLCSDPGGDVTCRDAAGPGDRVAPTAAVVGTLVRDRGYAIERLADRTIAGEPARCVRLTWRAGPVVAALGSDSVRCHARDGVPSYHRVAGVGTVDERRATTLDRDPEPDDLVALVDGVGPVPAELSAELVD